MPFYGVPCRQLRVSDRGTRRDRCDRRASPTAGLPGAAPDAVQFHPSRILLWIDLRVSFRSIDNSARLSHGPRRRSGPSYLWISYAGDGRGGGSAALRSRREHYGAAAGAPRTGYSRQASRFRLLASNGPPASTSDPNGPVARRLMDEGSGPGGEPWRRRLRPRVVPTAPPGVRSLDPNMISAAILLPQVDNLPVRLDLDRQIWLVNQLLVVYLE